MAGGTNKVPFEKGALVDMGVGGRYFEVRRKEM